MPNQNKAEKPHPPMIYFSLRSITNNVNYEKKAGRGKCENKIKVKVKKKDILGKSKSYKKQSKTEEKCE